MNYPLAHAAHAEQTAPLAILSALPEEQDSLLPDLRNARCVRYASRDFWCGQLHGHAVVLALSRVGKVAAATTAAALIGHFGARAIVFTGVAGGVGPGVRVGDVVLGSHFVQHDMDASPLFPRFEIPLTGQTIWLADQTLLAQLHAAAARALAHQCYAGAPVTLHQGLIASGDQFVRSAEMQAALCADLQALGHSPLAVEMEGAAVAQTCADHGVPFVAVRSISDRADAHADVSFSAFVATTARHYAHAIVRQWLAASDQPAAA